MTRRKPSRVLTALGLLAFATIPWVIAHTYPRTILAVLVAWIVFGTMYAKRRLSKEKDS